MRCLLEMLLVLEKAYIYNLYNALFLLLFYKLIINEKINYRSMESSYMHACAISSCYTSVLRERAGLDPSPPLRQADD
jgi:hypothetical protein